MTMQFPEINYLRRFNDFFQPFSEKNLPYTIVLVASASYIYHQKPFESTVLVGSIATAFLARIAYRAISQKNRLIQKIEQPQVQIDQAKQFSEEKALEAVCKEAIKTLQDENEKLKEQLAGFEGGAIHELLDAPMKVGLAALKEEKAALQHRIKTHTELKAGFKSQTEKPAILKSDPILSGLITLNEELRKHLALLGAVLPNPVDLEEDILRAENQELIGMITKLNSQTTNTTHLLQPKNEHILVTLGPKSQDDPAAFPLNQTDIAVHNPYALDFDSILNDL